MVLALKINPVASVLQLQPFMWDWSSCWHQHHITKTSEKHGEEAQPVSMTGLVAFGVLVQTRIN